ncbi:MAG: hypothetical protein H7301_12105 [Cryobacterium sp.]|nr:hypothetical protein [Oligoflexia bacterium]
MRDRALLETFSLRSLRILKMTAARKMDRSWITQAEVDDFPIEERWLKNNLKQQFSPRRP